MSETLVLKGGRVIDPVNGIDEKRDLAVQEGVLVPPDTIKAKAEIIDVNGLVVTPGLIDIHVHLRDPGQTDKEDIITGTRGAARGGFTTILAMPNTCPAIDSVAHLEEVVKRIDKYATVRVLQSAKLSTGRDDCALTDAGGLKEAGAAALTDDGACIQSSALMLAAMRQAQVCGLPVIDHAEDVGVAGSGIIHAGEVSRKLGLNGKNRASEELIVARDIVLARETGCPIHIQHVSSAGTVELIRMAKAWGIPVTGEATPHHLSLTDDACLQYGVNAKMNPPLRTEKDRQSILEGIADGTLSVIATDHAPHTEAEKAIDFERAPFGIIGLETAVPICLTELYHKRRISLFDLVARFTAGPRSVLGISSGTLSNGAPADITVLDPEAQQIIDVSRLASKSRNCPYHGWKCTGKVVATLVAGKWVYQTT
ncbi:MAG: dihydroorotase [Lentisphaeria bacterium]